MTHIPEPLDRVLATTIRSLKLLGAASAGWGFVFVFVWGYFNKFERFRPTFIALGLIVWAVPGVVFYLCGWSMEQERRRRAAQIAVIFAVIQGHFALAGLVASVTMPPVSPIPILLCVMWVAAIGQLLVHLRRSLSLLDIDAEKRHGFDVQTKPPPVAVVPIEDSSRQ